jgi:hypothetical protein
VTETNGIACNVSSWLANELAVSTRSTLCEQAFSRGTQANILYLAIPVHNRLLEEQQVIIDEARELADMAAEEAAEAKKAKKKVYY